MEHARKANPVEGSRIIPSLREILHKIHAPSACGLGIINSLSQGALVSPHIFINTGFAMDEPAERLETGKALPLIFCAKGEESIKGTSGCLTYDVQDTQYMMAVMWECLAAPPGNHYGIRCLDKRPCDEGLFVDMHTFLHNAGTETTNDEHGFRLHAEMTTDPKCLLLVDCAPVVESLRVEEPVKAGDKLQESIRKILEQCKSGVACCIGINNWTTRNLGNPRYAVTEGKIEDVPSDVLEPQMGAPVLFVKREFSLHGTCGSFCYDIGDSDSLLAVTWCVPINSKVGENMFNVHIVKRGDYKEDITERMKKDWTPASKGELKRDEEDFHITAVMGTEGKAIINVSLNE